MLNDKQLEQFLSGIDAFAGISSETMHKLVSSIEERSCQPGEVVVCQDARGTELCIVLEGELLVTITEKPNNDDGQVVPAVREVVTLSKGDLFGEIGVISGMDSSATVAATAEGCRILTLGERKLHEQVLHNSPTLAAGLLRSMKRYL